MSLAQSSLSCGGLLEEVDFYRIDATRLVQRERRSELGQFLTPSSAARFIATISEPKTGEVRFLDPGAGVGSLTAAWVEEILSRENRPSSISITTFEADPHFCEYLRQTIELCRKACRDAGVGFSAEMVFGDFVAGAVDLCKASLFGPPAEKFDTVVMNPPYKKITSDSETRRLLRSVGIETSNLYTAFLWLTLKLLNKSGELVAITPRSFCNGPYFRPFRSALLRETAITRIHVFESRRTAFRDDDVLQENVVFRAQKSLATQSSVTVSTSEGPTDVNLVTREVRPGELVSPDDRDRVIHVVPDELGSRFAERIRQFRSTLSDLGIGVSTGRVVDFRAKEFLVPNASGSMQDANCAPLIYPMHFDAGRIKWPRSGRKPNLLQVTEATRPLLVPPGTYVLVKRFSAKEERRRVSAAVCYPAGLPDIGIAFENKLNFFHDAGRGIPVELAKGLSVYLNSTLVDSYFRLFSGHTQVNARDLRTLPYPHRETLARMGAHVGGTLPPQEEIDLIVSRELNEMAGDKADPVAAQRKMDEALEVLNMLGLPRGQLNVRSALTLLALLDLTPEKAWPKSSSPLLGITPIMDFGKRHYGKAYAPNSRETFRRQTMHQFVEAGIALYNPDEPGRAVNSPKAVYQIAPLLLDVLRTRGTKRWKKSLGEWLDTVGTLKSRYSRAREMAKIPLKLPTGQQIVLSPGGQNILVEKIIHEFCPCFVPGGKPIYVGDTEEKYAFFDKDAIKALGVTFNSHGKMPDVVIHHVAKNWLILVEAVTSHGPIDGKRRDELKRLFAVSTAPLVYVTAFMDRSAMVRFLGEISWETEVWVAEAPTHMIHFNGERFLGPYES